MIETPRENTERFPHADARHDSGTPRDSSATPESSGFPEASVTSDSSASTESGAPRGRGSADERRASLDDEGEIPRATTRPLEEIVEGEATQERRAGALAAEAPVTAAAAAVGDVLEPVIGLEVHVQLKTDSKIFCACSTAFGAPPNTQTCPICMGFPGTLPVLNARAVEYALKAALALNCAVHHRSIFARKNYFYPDLPKGYQISQFDQPLATDGWLDLTDGLEASTGGDGNRPSGGRVREPEKTEHRVEGAAGEGAAGEGAAGEGAAGENAAGEVAASAEGRRIRIVRLHLEEDAGKSFHGMGDGGGTLLDFNRCGVPLIEIVSAPDIRSPAEAYLYLTRLKQIMKYLGVSDVNMEEGSLRCDANVSVRPAATSALGTKTEIKNLNSFKNVEHALEFEIARQIEELRQGRAVEHQTLLWDAPRGEARPMRSKELSHDYRDVPEPDLGPLVLDPLEVEEWRRSLPELPAAKAQRLAAQYGVPRYDAGVLSATRELADWYERAVAFYPHSPKEVSNWVMGEVLRVLNERQIEIDAFPVQPEQLAELLALKERGEISGRAAKSVFEKMVETGRDPGPILEEMNLRQISDEAELRGLSTTVLEERPQEVAGYLGGREQLLSFFIGEIMKKTRGRANPKAAGEILRELLEARRAGGAAGANVPFSTAGVEPAPVRSAPESRAESPPATPEAGPGPVPSSSSAPEGPEPPEGSRT